MPKVQNEVFILVENPKSTPAKNYKGYLVRVWRSSSEAPWRASAWDTMSGEQHHFANLESLLLFLRGETIDQENLEIKIPKALETKDVGHEAIKIKQRVERKK